MSSDLENQGEEEQGIHIQQKTKQQTNKIKQETKNKTNSGLCDFTNLTMKRVYISIVGPTAEDHWHLQWQALFLNASLSLQSLTVKSVSLHTEYSCLLAS